MLHSNIYPNTQQLITALDKNTARIFINEISVTVAKIVQQKTMWLEFLKISFSVCSSTLQNYVINTFYYGWENHLHNLSGHAFKIEEKLYSLETQSHLSKLFVLDSNTIFVKQEITVDKLIDRNKNQIIQLQTIAIVQYIYLIKNHYEKIEISKVSIKFLSDPIAITINAGFFKRNKTIYFSECFNRLLETLHKTTLTRSHGSSPNLTIYARPPEQRPYSHTF